MTPPGPRLNQYRAYAIVFLVIYVMSVAGATACHIVDFPHSYIPATAFAVCAILALLGIMCINQENSR